MAIPPSTAAPAILAARPISIAFAEAEEALASFGFGSRRAGGIEHLRPPLRGDRSGKIAELLRLEREQLIARLCRLEGAGRGLARGHQRRNRAARIAHIPDAARLGLPSTLARTTADVAQRR